MAIVMIDDTNLANIANAIRTKEGSTNTYKPSEMADAINNLSVGDGDGILEAENKFTKLVDRSITEVMAEDLAGVTEIGNYAFYKCTNLTSIIIPNSVTIIGYYAFRDCTSLTSVNIGNSVTSIYNYAFFGCTNLESIEIPNSVTSISEAVFCNCTSLTSITIPDSVTSIGRSAFKSCTSLTSITIPDSVTSIGSSAFESCTSLTSINIPDSVTSIDSSAFKSCTNLTNINIPNGVTRINPYMFSGCYLMQYYDFSQYTAVPTLSNANVFTGIPADCEIRVPAALYDEWIAATNWVTYADHIVAV